MPRVESSPTFAFDVNFRFDVDDPPWRAFFERHGLQPVAYDDMGKLTHALRASVQTVSYLPAANYFYVRDMPAYEPFASAVYAAENTTSLTSLLVVRASSGVTDVEQLRGARLGIAHEYCTTSYFSPAMVAREHGSSIDQFFGELVHVGPYELQVDALIAGQVDATMVQEDVWRKHARYAKLTRVIARKDDLPTPVMLIDRRARPELRHELHDVACSHRPPTGPDTLFSGFVDFKRAQVEAFFAASDGAVPALTPAG
jgi:ABC-type phosphate/phosphonate transport system substrate-binding protein